MNQGAPVQISKGWQELESLLLARIHSREWLPGASIPNEIDLAKEYACSRATVNRAMRALADTGLVERKRRAGTRVALHPVRKATLSIPIIRHDIEERGHDYSYSLIEENMKVTPTVVAAKMALPHEQEVLHVRALHMGDGKPFAYEDRWINPVAIPHLTGISFENLNANEWLIANASFTRGDFAFGAMSAGWVEAAILDISVGEALFTIERSTWRGEVSITNVKLVFAPGYRMHTSV